MTNVLEDRVLKEIYNGITLETKEGNQISICMRDDTFEINVMPKDKDKNWFRVDMQKITINKMEGVLHESDRRHESVGQNK